jgi:hypothetical protein
MRTGLYYADDLQILIGEEGSHGSGTNGQVTVVSGNIIKLTSNDMNLSAYMGQGSPIPGLLFFSDFQALADPCEFIPSEEPVINMAGSSGSVIPSVDHTTEGCPENIDGCYVQSSNVFTGLIYAPNGRVATSGAKSTFIGAIVSWTIDVNGDRSLFITNPDLIPSGVVQIFLDQ